MTTLTVQTENRLQMAGNFIRSTRPLLWADFSRHDGLMVPSDDARGAALTMSSPVWSTNGRSFNGVSDIVTTNGKLDAFLAGSFSLVCWITARSGAGLMIGAGSQAAGKRIYFATALNGTYRMGFFTNSNVSAKSYDNTNQGIMFGGTYNQSEVRMYRNGLLTDVTAVTEGYDGSGANLSVGAFTPSGDYFQGVIHQFIIYGRAITAQEMQQLYLISKWRYQ